MCGSLGCLAITLGCASSDWPFGKVEIRCLRRSPKSTTRAWKSGFVWQLVRKIQAGSTEDQTSPVFSLQSLTFSFLLFYKIVRTCWWLSEDDQSWVCVWSGQVKDCGVRHHGVLDQTSTDGLTASERSGVRCLGGPTRAHGGGYIGHQHWKAIGLNNTHQLDPISRRRIKLHSLALCIYLVKNLFYL
jgi:hypothetical protein